LRIKLTLISLIPKKIKLLFNFNMVNSKIDKKNVTLTLKSLIKKIKRLFLLCYTKSNSKYSRD
jgi:hypothetical protein